MSYALAESVNWNPDFMKTETDQQQTESALAPCPGYAAGGRRRYTILPYKCPRCGSSAMTWAHLEWCGTVDDPRPQRGKRHIAAISDTPTETSRKETK